MPVRDLAVGKKVKRLHDFYAVAVELQQLIDPTPPEFQCRRRHRRTPRSISVSVQPLDDDFDVNGDRFWLVSRDISPGGIGLISYDPIEADYVRLGLLNEKVSIIGRVRHNTSIGDKYPLFLIGIEFMSDIEV